MKVMVLADIPCKALWDASDPRERLRGIDLILSCGDLPPDYLEYIATFTSAPILYVHGNHDCRYDTTPPGGCTCIEDTVYVYRGLRILGLGGSIQYNPNAAHQYTERAMCARIRKLFFRLLQTKGFDILLTHSPAQGINDGPDGPHKGFSCFTALLEKYRPTWFIHGHVHMQYNAKLPRVCTYGDTTVINACERYVFDMPCPDEQTEHGCPDHQHTRSFAIRR